MAQAFARTGDMTGTTTGFTETGPDRHAGDAPASGLITGPARTAARDLAMRAAVQG